MTSNDGDVEDHDDGNDINNHDSAPASQPLSMMMLLMMVMMKDDGDNDDDPSITSSHDYHHDFASLDPT